MEELEIEAYHKRHSQIRQEKAENEKKRQAAVKKNKKKAAELEKQKRKGLVITISPAQIPYWQKFLVETGNQEFDLESKYWIDEHILAMRDIFYSHFDFFLVPSEDLVFRLKPAYCLALYRMINHELARFTLNTETGRIYNAHFRTIHNQLDQFLKNLQ